MTIRFYDTSGEYGAFSNFTMTPITIHDRTYPTVEHYFQAMKFRGVDEKYAHKISTAPRPQEAAKLGRDRRYHPRRNWDTLRDEVMRMGVLAKFSQHDELQKLLLSTGEETIIEEAERDPYWGTGPDGRGRNRLGQILMEVRDTLRHDELHEMYGRLERAIRK